MPTMVTTRSGLQTTNYTKEEDIKEDPEDSYDKEDSMDRTSRDSQEYYRTSRDSQEYHTSEQDSQDTVYTSCDYKEESEEEEPQPTATARSRLKRTPTPVKPKFRAAGAILDSGRDIQVYDIETTADLVDNIKNAVQPCSITWLIKLALLLSIIAMAVVVFPKFQEKDRTIQTKLSQTLDLFSDLEKVSVLGKIRLKEIKNNIIYKIKDPEKDDPITVFIMTSKKKRTNVEEEIRTIAHIFNKAMSASAVLKYISEDTWPDNVKYDEGLNQVLMSDTFSLIISDFEKFTWPKAKLFYQYCDNDTAPYKDKMFIFIVTVSDCLAGDESGQIIQLLESQWGGEPGADIPALVNRLSAISVCVM